MVEQGQGAEACVPAGSSLVLGVDRKRNPADLARDRERASSRRKEKVRSQSASLVVTRDREASQAEYGYLIAAKLAGQRGRDAGKFNRTGRD